MPATPPSEIVVRDGRLYHLGIAKGQVAPNLFLVGDPARAYRVAARFDSIEHEVKNREYVTLTGQVGSLSCSVIGTGIGTDNVEIAVIEAFVAMAFDLETQRRLEEVPRVHVIRVGTSGGARTDLAPGTLCIAEYALGLDATGPYYEHSSEDPRVAKIERDAERLLDEAVDDGSRFKGRLLPYASKASATVFASLEWHARRADSRVASGITVSSPGFYGPSSRFIDGVVNTVPDIKGTLARLEVDGRRVLNFEMESSLLFHLAEHLGLKAGTICPAISQPDSADAIVDYATRIETSIDIALAAMAELAAV